MRIHGFARHSLPPKRVLPAPQVQCGENKHPLYSSLLDVKNQLVDFFRPHFPQGKMGLYLGTVTLKPASGSFHITASTKNWATHESALSDHREGTIAAEVEKFFKAQEAIQRQVRRWKPTARERQNGMSLSVFIFVTGQPASEKTRPFKEVFVQSVRQLQPHLIATFAKDPHIRKDTHQNGQPSETLTLKAMDFKHWGMGIRFRHPLLQKTPLKVLLREHLEGHSPAEILYEATHPAQGRLRGILLSHPELAPGYDAWAKTRPDESDLTFDYFFPLCPFSHPKKT